METNKLNFALCIKNEGYAASLEVRKVYRLLSDSDASKYGQVRIVDESGEDYLFPADYFVPVELPQQAKEALLALTASA